MIRSGFSFKVAYGHLEDVASRLTEIGWEKQPICDRTSTFAFNRWSKLTTNPVFGVELAVVANMAEKRPRADFWRFFAVDSLKPLHDLIGQATSNPGEPSLHYEEAQRATGLIKIAGNRAMLEYMRPAEDLFVALQPSLPIGLYRSAKAAQYKFIATPDNVYPREADLEVYRIALGWRSGTQTYPQHILSDEEWAEAMYQIDTSERLAALRHRQQVLAMCTARLEKATLYQPVKELTLREMCELGAVAKGINLEDQIYSLRLSRELALIAEKKFEDYFYIIADIVQWSKKRMIVGPARGSSCGSLVCHLLDITAVDPIPFNLIFERFIDTTRADLPDIDIDFADTKRDLVFKYVEDKYGRDKVARLGTTGMFMPKSAINAVGAALRIPTWKTEKVKDSLIHRSLGDSRARMCLEDTLNDTEPGRALLAEYPAVVLGGRLEGHPANAGQHAAGVCITQEPIDRYVAIDQRQYTTMCDKKDAEDFNMLKIDMLGLTQLSIFERTLELIGEKPVNGFLETLPLDDQSAFDVLNRRQFSGIFQFNGGSLQSLSKQIHFDSIEDIIAITALARPGPLNSGSAQQWVLRKMGSKETTYPHPIFEPYMSDTLGVVAYQEQILRIGREVGDLSWADVTKLRQSMSKSLGKEHFDQYGDRWKAGAAKKGVPAQVLDKFWDEMCNYGSWCLSGETEFINPHPQYSGQSTLKLKDLYASGGKPPWSRRSLRAQKLLCLQEGTIKPARLVEVTASGERETWLVEVDSGEKLRATMEHRFLCADGKYRPLKRLQSGYSVLMMGEKEPTKRKKKKGTGRGGQNWWPILRAGGPLLKRQIAKLRSIYRRCQNCKKQPYQETHHVNGDHTDHRFENLMPVCRKCHRAFHGVSAPHSKGKSPRVAHIVSISQPKIELTYDVAMPFPHNNFVANGFIVHNSFNKAHAVAYGLVSYFCCWLKAYHPLEFAAATLDAEALPLRQIMILRELKAEGTEYIPVDPERSEARWTITEKDDGTRALLGPLTLIKGIGPSTMMEVLTARETGAVLRPALAKKLINSKTAIDSLYPVADALARLHPDLEAIKIRTKPTPIKDVHPGREGAVVVIAVPTKIAPLDENEPQRVAKRNGREFKPPTTALNLFMRDDTDEIFCKVNRFDYQDLGRKIAETGRTGKSLYAIKGTVPKDFRMISITDVKYLGEIEDEIIPAQEDEQS